MENQVKAEAERRKILQRNESPDQIERIHQLIDEELASELRSIEQRYSDNRKSAPVRFLKRTEDECQGVAIYDVENRGSSVLYGSNLPLHWLG